MNDEVIAARNAIGHIFSQLNIKTVVCVDDFYSVRDPDTSVALVIGWVTQAILLGEAEQCGALFGDAGFFDVPDEEIWRRRLRTRWSGLSEANRSTIVDRLASIVGLDVNTERDRESASRLAPVIPDGVALRELSPEDWEEQGEAILANRGEDEAALCLFDHNLAAAAGYSDSGGIRLLEGALNSHRNPPVMCGLLTHTVSVGEEIQRCGQLARENNLERQEFLVLSKDRLSSPMRFAHGLKMVSLNHARDKLTTCVKDLALTASEEATSRLMDLDIYDFDYMVLRSSTEEGVWEVETLFRLFEVFRRVAFRSKALAPESRESLDREIAAIRRIREADTVPDSERYPPGQRWALRRIELYADGDFINQAHLPLEAGDLFQVGQRQLILVAQPCDLMVRQNGHRSATVFTLLNITENGSDLNGFRLPYFYPGTGKDAYVKFRSSYYISADILDLAVFDSQGRCRFDPAALCPSLLHAPWSARFQRVQRELGRHQRRIAELREAINGVQLPENARNYLTGSLAAKVARSDLPIECDFEDGLLTFGIRRIGRYENPGSERLLRQFTSFLARDAGVHDYTPPEYLADGVWKSPERATTALVGAVRSKRFHKVGCSVAARIGPSNRICFEDRDAAINYGRQPCSACRP